MEMKVDNKRKNKSCGFSIYEIVLIIVITSLISALSTGIIINNNYRTSNGISYSKLLEDENVKQFLSVYASILNNYYEDIDKEAAIESAINGLTSYLGDKYTSYLSTDEAKALANSLSGRYDGIGVLMDSKEPGIIYEVFDDSPASNAGLLAGDIITKINGEDITGKSNSDITALIKGDEDKSVDLVIRRNEEVINVTVKIDSVLMPAIDYEVINANEKNIGYIHIKTFSSTLGEQVSKALEKMDNSNIESLIIDVRNNGGGYLSAATDVASLFLEKGKVIYSLEAKDGTNAYYDETDEMKSYPIMVLINEGSASSSEILTSALVDSYGATTLGMTSYGKGKVQQTISLDDGSLVKYTASKWLRPNGTCIDEFGIIPNYAVELEYVKDKDGNITEVIDTQFEKAIRIMSGEDTE